MLVVIIGVNMVSKLLAFAMTISLIYSILYFLMVCVGEITSVVATLGIAHLIIRTLSVDV